MTYLIEDYYNALDKIARFDSAQDWDNVGLLVGSPNTRVKAAIVALDATRDVLAEAKLLHANLIITHHPVIFKPIKRIDGDSLLYALVSANMNVLSVHTNYDSAAEGVNDSLCGILGLTGVRVLQGPESAGIGRIGELCKPLLPEELAAFVKSHLKAGLIKYTRGSPVSVIAVCGGSGGGLWRDAREQGAQALITSEVKHDQFLDAAHNGFILIDAGHAATESVAIKPLAARISQLLPGSVVTVSKSQPDPVCYL